MICLVQGTALFFDNERMGIGNGEQNQPARNHDEQTAGDGDERTIAANLAALINAQTNEIRAYREQRRRSENKSGLRETLTIDAKNIGDNHMVNPKKQSR